MKHPKKSKRQRFNLSLDPGVQSEADRAAFHQGKPFSQVVETLLVRWLEEGAILPSLNLEEERPSSAAIWKVVLGRS